MSTVSVMLVEDHAVFRQMLALILEQEPGFEVVAQAGSLAEARRELEVLGGVDVAIVDLRLPDGNGTEIIGRLCAGNAHCTVLVLTADDNLAVYGRTVEAGASGVLHKSAGMGEGMDEADPESGAWRIPPSGVSDGGHTYTAKAIDAADNSSAASASVTVLVDSAAPSVVRVDPRNGAKGVAPLANLTVTFSEAMRPTTVSKATVKLVSSGRVVPAKVTYGVEAKTATLNPDARLVAGTKYRAVVSTGAEDAAGNPLRAAEGWRFSAKP